MPGSKKSKIAGPDILRGFAALSVIIVHLIASSNIDFGHFITQVGNKFTASVTLFFLPSVLFLSLMPTMMNFLTRAILKAFI